MTSLSANIWRPRGSLGDPFCFFPLHSKGASNSVSEYGCENMYQELQFPQYLQNSSSEYQVIKREFSLVFTCFQEKQGKKGGLSQFRWNVRKKIILRYLFLIPDFFFFFYFFKESQNIRAGSGFQKFN